MRVLVVFEVDEDQVLDNYEQGTSLEEALEGELGWVHSSGLEVRQIICPDSLESNDQNLGSQIRKLINE